MWVEVLHPNLMVIVEKVGRSFNIKKKMLILGGKSIVLQQTQITILATFVNMKFLYNFLLINLSD